MGLETATDGHIVLDNKGVGIRPDRGTRYRDVSSVQMVFQNPFDTLNPSMTVGRQIMRALEVFGIGKNESARRQRMLELLDLVKLPRDFADRMPRQLSGGQKQRVGIARAFAGDAKIVVADEPVSALDVSVQAAVTDLLMEIQREKKTTLLFISHDLSIVRYLSDRVMVMYLGHVVELAPPIRSSARPTTPIRRRCCRPFRSPTPRSRRNISCWKATSPRPWIRRPAARSRRAAAGRRTCRGGCAKKRCRR